MQAGLVEADPRALRRHDIDRHGPRRAVDLGAHDLVAAHILDPPDAGGQAGARAVVGQEAGVFRAHPDLHLALETRIGRAQPHRPAGHAGRGSLDLRRQQVHAGRADEIADEGVGRGLEQRLGRADLDHAALMHHHHLVGEGQRLGLVMGDVDHGVAEIVVQRFQLRAQLPFHLRVDDGQRFVEEQRVDVLAHHPAAEGDLLLRIRRQPAGLAVQRRLHADHRGDARHPLGDIGGIGAAVAQRKGQVLAHRHGVVDHRELEHLRDVAGRGRGVGHVDIVEQDPPLAGPQQARDDVEQRGFPAARGAEQRVGLSVRPVVVELLQRVVLGPFRVGEVGMREVVERDLGHGPVPPQAAAA